MDVMKVPVLFKKKEDCCGCTACYAICPKYAITMQIDEDGFEYPFINADICVGCEYCLKICPMELKKIVKMGKRYDF